MMRTLDGLRSTFEEVGVGYKGGSGVLVSSPILPRHILQAQPEHSLYS